MGSWDCYCAICGGPFGGSQISRKPRTSRFLRRRAQEAIERQERGLADDESVFDASDESDGGGEDDDGESLDSGDEEWTYDCEVITEDDVRWTEIAHVIGSAHRVKGVSKAFVSGPGIYDYFGSVEINQGLDWNTEGVNVSAMSCYSDYDNEGIIFPFHWPCYELLAKCISGSFDVDQLDKDILFNAMHDLSPDYGVSLEVDYGIASKFHEQFFQTVPGYEFVVINPRNFSGITGAVRAMLEAKSFIPINTSNLELQPRVRSDPFTTLPYDIIYQISALLLDTDLTNLANASWPIHQLLQSNDRFWSGRVKTTLPWFFELHDQLNHLETMSRADRMDWKRLYLWAENITRPRKWMKGPWMGMAKRRITWHVCEQLKAKYLSLKHT